MINSSLDSRLGVMAPMVTSKNRASGVLGYIFFGNFSELLNPIKVLVRDSGDFEF